MAAPPPASARTIVFWFLIALLAWGVSRPVSAQTPQVIGKVVSLDGLADVLPSGARAWTPLTQAAPVHLGDTLHTRAHSRLKVLLSDDSILSLGEASMLRLDQLVYNPSQRVRSSLLHLVRGKLLSIVSKLSRWAGTFGIETDTAIIGVRGTEFLVEADPGAGGTGANASTRVLVLEGQVAVRGILGAAAAEILVPAGRGTQVFKGRAPQPAQPVSPQILIKLKQEVEVRHDTAEPEEHARTGGGSGGATQVKETENGLPAGPQGGTNGPNEVEGKPPADALDVLGTGSVSGAGGAGAGAGTPSGTQPPIAQQPPPPPTGSTTVNPTFHMQRP